MLKYIKKMQPKIRKQNLKKKTYAIKLILNYY